MSRPLTNQEREVFEAIQDAPNIALVQTKFDGEETAVICAMNADDDGQIHVTPLAVLVTDQIAARLSDPTDES